MRTTLKAVALLAMAVFTGRQMIAQNTQIRGFVDVSTTYDGEKVSFGFGEQDLFITSTLNDRFSFLGESVFKFNFESHTEFSVSVERVIMKYNYKGNHNILAGKHHTPINYWNDTYHHGRVFFPTIERPALFAADIIPLHTTGISLSGQNLGKLKFGYDLMIGNGLGSEDIRDNDKYKSLTAAVHMKPVSGLRVGFSYYHDHISEGAHVHDHDVHYTVKQQLFTPSVAYFGKHFEALTETTFAVNQTDTTGSSNSVAAYAYAGYKIAQKFIPYVRFDYLNYSSREVYYEQNDLRSFLLGLRYEINFLAAVKLEYQHAKDVEHGVTDKVVAQLAIGF